MGVLKPVDDEKMLMDSESWESYCSSTLGSRALVGVVPRKLRAAAVCACDFPPYAEGTKATDVPEQIMRGTGGVVIRRISYVAVWFRKFVTTIACRHSDSCRNVDCLSNPQAVRGRTMASRTLRAPFGPSCICKPRCPPFRNTLDSIMAASSIAIGTPFFCAKGLTPPTW
jgi:hypothetical protein